MCLGRVDGRPRTWFFKTKKETKVKTRIFVLMLVLGCLFAISVYAAKESSKEKAAAPVVEKDVAVKAEEKKAPLFETEMDKVSYAIGAQMGQNFKRQKIEIKIESLIRGLRDATAGKELAFTEDEMKQIITSFSQRMMAQRKELQKLDAARNLAVGKVFLDANKKKEGVKVLPSGLQYKILKEGTGKSPTAEDKVKTHYRGTLIDGTEFDNSYKRNKPAEFAVKAVIKGWTEALQLMKEGATWELYIPPDLAYGERGNRNIPGNSALIFQVELIEIVK
jgi:FKBP-type peptidyl-prolyl cis-trans isomerase FklB